MVGLISFKKFRGIFLRKKRQTYVFRDKKRLDISHPVDFKHVLHVDTKNLNEMMTSKVRQNGNLGDITKDSLENYKKSNKSGYV